MCIILEMYVVVWCRFKGWGYEMYCVWIVVRGMLGDVVSIDGYVVFFKYYKLCLLLFKG